MKRAILAIAILFLFAPPLGATTILPSPYGRAFIENLYVACGHTYEGGLTAGEYRHIKVFGTFRCTEEGDWDHPSVRIEIRVGESKEVSSEWHLSRHGLFHQETEECDGRAVKGNGGIASAGDEGTPTKQIYYTWFREELIRKWIVELEDGGHTFVWERHLWYPLISYGIRNTTDSDGYIFSDRLVLRRVE